MADDVTVEAISQVTRIQSEAELADTTKRRQGEEAAPTVTGIRLS